MSWKTDGKFEPNLCRKVSLDVVRSLAFRDGSVNYFIEEKYDGIRAIIKHGKLYNREGEEITEFFPEFYNLEDVSGIWDGEIIAASGKFEDISGRIHTKDKFKRRLISKLKPAKFMCWDCLENSKGEDFSLYHLFARKKALDAEDFPIIFTWFNVVPYKILGDEFDEIWESVLQNKKEGVVIKHIRSNYDPGKRTWMKLKAWEETIASFTKYDRHSKGITIEQKIRIRVNINGKEADLISAMIDKYGSLNCEIQYMPTTTGAWRFPSFRKIIGVDEGIRKIRKNKIQEAHK